jgi:hypothetical protein
MAKTLFELVQDYLNRRNLPETFKYSTSSGGGNQPPVDDDDDDDNVTTTPGIPNIFLGRDDGPMSAFSATRKQVLNPFSRIGDVVPGMMGKGLQALQDLLPVNRRAILENQLRKENVFTDDIGRIVANPTQDYNTVENVMAGYNANMITQDTIDKRVGNIADTLREKYDLSRTEIQGIIDGTLSAEQMAAVNAKAIMPGTNQTTNLIKQIKAVSDYGKKFIGDKKVTGPGGSQTEIIPSDFIKEVDLIENALQAQKDNVDILDDFGIVSSSAVPDIVGGKTKRDTIVSTEDDDFGITADDAFKSTIGLPGAQFQPGGGFVDQGGFGEFGQLSNIQKVAAQNEAAGQREIDNRRKAQEIIRKQSSGLGSIGSGGMGGGRDFSPKTKARSDKIKETFNYQVQPTKSFTAPTKQGQSPRGSDSGGGGGRTKIVCTMMNETYGFGSFRNKIWIKYAKDNLKPEHQKGYHKIFLPLVKIAKTNKLVRKVLEHIAVHRTIDIRQESRNKVHLLGRIYRKVLEPICYLVGKYGKD